MKNLIKIALVLFIFGTFISCGDNKKEKRQNTSNTPRTELKQPQYSFENPPVFRKDGELHFVDSNTGQNLFTIEIEVASNEFERALGLMFRPEMPENQGMLFLMEREERQSFYMRNTLIPLDIIYVNAKFEIVDIYKNTKVLNDNSLPSAAPAKYVVEINAGLSDKYNIKIGDTILF